VCVWRLIVSSYSDTFQITKDPSSGSDDLYFEITCNGSQIFIMCVVGVWWHILNLLCVCVCVCVHACVRVRTLCDGLETTVVSSPSQCTHTLHSFRICHQTLITYMINICEPLQVISKYRSSLPDDGAFVIWNVSE